MTSFVIGGRGGTPCASVPYQSDRLRGLAEEQLRLLGGGVALEPQLEVRGDRSGGFGGGGGLRFGRRLGLGGLGLGNGRRLGLGGLGLGRRWPNGLVAGDDRRLGRGSRRRLGLLFAGHLADE